MKPGLTIILFGMTILGLSACGGRSAQPIAVTQTTDDTLSCTYAEANIEANNRRMTSLLKEKDAAGNRNAGLIIGFGLVGAMFTDSTNSVVIEIRSLLERNKHLGDLMSTKSCADIPPLSPGDAENAEILRNIEAAKRAGAQPKCEEVGGWESYHQRTGRACQL